MNTLLQESKPDSTPTEPDKQVTISKATWRRCREMAVRKDCSIKDVVESVLQAHLHDAEPARARANPHQ